MQIVSNIRACTALDLTCRAINVFSVKRVHKTDLTRTDREYIAYPRKRVRRWVLRSLSGLALRLVCELKVNGRENLPRSGQFIMAGNHFHFADPVIFLWLSRRQVEFVAGFRMPNAPKLVRFIPKLWGIFPAFRGGYSRSTLDYAQQVLEQDGIVGIYPEGGAWADVLRPPRPGTAYLATRSGAQIVPIGIDGATQIFKAWRPRVTVNIGAPIGPFTAVKNSAERRKTVNAIGQMVMQTIATLLPEERRGVFADTEALRLEAEKVSDFPWEKREMRGT